MRLSRFTLIAGLALAVAGCRLDSGERETIDVPDMEAAEMRADTIDHHWQRFRPLEEPQPFSDQEAAYILHVNSIGVTEIPAICGFHMARRQPNATDAQVIEQCAIDWREFFDEPID